MQTASSPFDPNSPSGSFVIQVLAGLAVLLVIALFGWLLGPLKWLWRNYVLRKLLLTHRFSFVFNPSPERKQVKTITFMPDGLIGEGRNNNENTWRLRRGTLEVFGSDGLLYSRFRLDKDTGGLANTNDIDARSIRGQTMEAIWERVQSAD